MTGQPTYTSIRDGSIAHVAVEPGTDAERQRWRDLGEQLHEQMDAAIAESAWTLPKHSDDAEHLVSVGRAMEAIRKAEAAGDLDGVKEAVALYNALADRDGCPGITFLWPTWPPRHGCGAEGVQFDIGTAIPGGMIAEIKSGAITILSVGKWVRPGFERQPPSMYTLVDAVGRVIRPVRP
jgi:hypothetical protein